MCNSRVSFARGLTHKDCLSVGDPPDIEIVGDDISQAMRISVGHNLASKAGHLLWFGALRTPQKSQFHMPLGNLFEAHGMPVCCGTT